MNRVVGWVGAVIDAASVPMSVIVSPLQVTAASAAVMAARSVIVSLR